MSQVRNTERRREDTWDDEALSTSGQEPATISAGGNTQPELRLLTATPGARNTRRRREDIWDSELSDQPNNDSSTNSQDASARHTSGDRGWPSDLNGLMTWNEMLEANETPPADETSSPEEQVRLPIFQETSQQAPSSRSELAPPERVRLPRFQEASQQSSFEPEPALVEQVRLPRFQELSRQALSFEPQQGPPARPWPHSSLQPQLPSYEANRRPLFRPYHAGPEPHTLEEVRVPDRAELDVMKQIHGRPRPMSDAILYDFCRAYEVPLDIASDMRARSMIGLYPSSLIYLDYQGLATIPPRRHWYFRVPIPPLYWARILYVKQGQQREHVEHVMSKAPGPCLCNRCQYDREQGVLMGPGG